jgi:prevent-host-death family protein
MTNSYLHASRVVPIARGESLKYTAFEGILMFTAESKQYVVNERGEKVAVVISIEEYEKLLEELEDLEAIREAEEARASGETPVPFDEAIARIERTQK